MTTTTNETTVLTTAQEWAIEQVQYLANRTHHALAKVAREAQDGMARMAKGQTPSYTMEADVTGRSSIEATEAAAKLKQAVDTAVMVQVPQALIMGAYKEGVSKAEAGRY
jgi:hypothetical protein